MKKNLDKMNFRKKILDYIEKEHLTQE